MAGAAAPIRALAKKHGDITAWAKALGRRPSTVAGWRKVPVDVLLEFEVLDLRLPRRGELLLDGLQLVAPLVGVVGVQAGGREHARLVEQRLALDAQQLDRQRGWCRRGAALPAEKSVSGFDARLLRGRGLKARCRLRSEPCPRPVCEHAA